MDVQIVSFGYLHGEPPTAHLTLDLRHHFRDPHINPALRHLTARDPEVRHTVMATTGIADLIVSTAFAVQAFLAGPSTGDVTVAFGCAGGRHRAATAAMALAALVGGHTEAIDGMGLFAYSNATRYTTDPATTWPRVRLTHRDLDKPVVTR